MFIGSIPKKVAQQMVSHVDLQKWRGVNVCCSGSFRIEQAIRNVNREIPIISNDVSLVSSIVGLAKTSGSTVFSFKNDLEHLNEFLTGTPETQLALIAYAMQLAKYKSDNVYCNSRREFLSREIDGIIASNKERAIKYLEAISINDFYMGDFLMHIDHAKQLGHGVMVFAPTYKGGYERIYKFINDNINWHDEPSYQIYDPKDSHDLITRLHDEKFDFAFFSDQMFPDVKPVMMYEGSNRPIYIYSSTRNSSVRRDAPKHKAFKYEAVQPEKLRPDSEITAIAVKSDSMNFLKDIYLAKGIAHKSGMFNVLFFADGALIGGAIYSLPQFGDKIRRIYLLSDFSVSRERRLSKLVAMLATARPIVDVLNKKFFIRIEQVLTTAFTKKPVSMKYRGIYKLDAKKDGFLNYSSHVREGSLNDTYADWWRKYGSKN